MNKAEAIEKALGQRLHAGEYASAAVPSETRLATEFGVSRMTARKALLALEEQGLLSRLPNGRLVVAERVAERARPMVAVLSSAWPGVPSGMMYRGLSSAAEAAGVQLRSLKFNHWDDPTVTETLAATARGTGGEADDDCLYSGVVIFPSSEPLPDLLSYRLERDGLRVLMVDLDCAGQGVVSLLPVPGSSLRELVRYLAGVGEGPIDCFNTQPASSPEEEVFACWREELAQLGRGGDLISDPVQPYENAMPKARELARTYLEGIELPRTVLCTTDFVAMALLHEVHELGLPIGKELKVAAVKTSDGFGQCFVPSLTALEESDCAVQFERCFRWMVAGTPWAGSKRIEADGLRLFVGGSTEARN